jgi:glycosyltransferase involved in cell wall biosynthesis
MPPSKKILFLVPYPISQAPSQRFRVELFFPELEKAGFDYRVQSFLDQSTWNNLYRGGGFFSKSWGVLKGFARRWKIILFGLKQFDYVFVHREAAPVGPPVFEWLVSRVYRKKMIYDFDDAIWIPNTSKENFFAGWIKSFSKVRRICKWSYKVVGGNDYLCDYARRYNSNVVKIPTSVDTVSQHNLLKDQDNGKIAIGWTGSHSTMKFLDLVLPVLQTLRQKFSFEFVVISNKAPAFNLEGLRYIPWNEETEVKDLLEMNIGVMPLENDPWGEGKCGFKIIQYLSLGIPAVASPVGVNKQIIDENVSGFLCETLPEWEDALATLLADPGKRKEMGLAGRRKIEREFSLEVQRGRFVGLFN